MPDLIENTPAAVAIDLGSTRFKLATVDAGGRLTGVSTADAPPASGDGLIREIDPAAIRDRAEALLTGQPAGLPLALISQRSSFVCWDRETGRELTPVVSWQDRRAADWCARHRSADALLGRYAGLLLSPHYAGPKLAAIVEQDSALRDALGAGDALFGTLDAWLAWHWTGGSVHRTDPTMAARTGMMDLSVGDWSDELLELFGIPRVALPAIYPSDAGPMELDNGLSLSAVLADQASGALAVLGDSPDAALVNLGTGGFVLRAIDSLRPRVPGYLTAPICGSAHRGGRYVLEGTINGAGPAVDRFGQGPTSLSAKDDESNAFALPDLVGVGSPHWRPELGLTLSPRAESLNTAGRRRIVIEGLLFRVCEILHGTGGGHLPSAVYLSGGLAAETSIARGLATLLGLPVRVLQESETTLLGGARLSLGLEPFADLPATQVEPSADGAYLREKYPRWRAWMAEVLDQ